MADLFWPGSERAHALMTDAALLEAMIAVEQGWLVSLAAHGLTPPSDLGGLVGPADLDALALDAEGGGNPVLGLVALLRERSGNAWVHRGLTSQDVVDTALILCLRETVTAVRSDLDAQIDSLVELAETHRSTVMAGRTLAQHAVPTTFGAKAAVWLTGLLDARDALAALTWPAQLGGAAGTLAAARALVPDDVAAWDLVVATADALGLEARTPWHTSRGPVTAIGDALVACTDAWGRIASDVVTLSRSEIGELAEPAGVGRGGSSTMPHKRNPILSVLLRRAAITAPGLASTLHLAAALANDERPDGGWHAEWAALRDLGRRTAVAASQARELLAGLEVNTKRMAATVATHHSDLHAEQAAITGFAGTEATAGSAADPAYLGLADDLITRVVRRAHATSEGIL
jgi:3-carboxy-cis,cis-muconate cycloisomerase